MLRLSVCCWHKTKHRFHSVIIGIGELLPCFSTRNVMAILDLRCLLGIRRKLGMLAIPTLNTRRQMRDKILERRLLWRLRLSGLRRRLLRLVIKLLSALHLFQPEL